MSSPLEFSLTVQYACDGEGRPSRSVVRRWAKAAQEKPIVATVRFVGMDEGRLLNREFRGKDYATNVLTFVYESDPSVGDLVICLPVVLREAHEQDKPIQAHLAHMIVHGMLHLQGYDHETGEEDALRMHARERQILARMRVPDPYG